MEEIKISPDTFKMLAPLYEAENFLHTWFPKNGIVFAKIKGIYHFKDMREGKQGTNLEFTCNTYTEALEFALQFVMNYRIEQATIALNKELEQTKENLYDEVWGHAGCLSIANGIAGDLTNVKMSPAMQAVASLRQAYDDLQKEVSAAIKIANM